MTSLHIPMRKLLLVTEVDTNNTEDLQIPKDKLLFTYVPSYDNTTENCDYIPVSKWVKELGKEYQIINFPRESGDSHRLTWDRNNRHHYEPTYLYWMLGRPLLKKLGIWSDIDEFTLRTVYFPRNYKVPVPKNPSTDLVMMWGDNRYKTSNWMDIYGYYNNFYDERKAYYKDSIYHKNICFPHACSGYINNQSKSEKRILVSGDSHAIPLIPILVHYFREVVYLDNRGKWKPEHLIEDFGRFDNYIFMLSDCHTKHHFFKKNFGLK